MTRPQPDPTLVSSLVFRALATMLAWSIPSSPIAAYVLNLALGLGAGDMVKALTLILIPVVIVVGVVWPLILVRVLYGRAFARRTEDRPGDRAARLLKLPYQVAFLGTQLPYFVGGLLYAGWACASFNRSPAFLALGGAIGLCFGFILSFQVATRVERSIMPHVLEEQRDNPSALQSDGSLFWPRQSWYFPYVFSGSIVSALVLMGAVVVATALKLREARYDELIRAGNTVAATELQEFSDDLMNELAWPVGLGSLFVLGFPTFTAWILARRQSNATGMVQRAITGLASGRPQAPNWISTDEVGELAVSVTGVLDILGEIPRTLTSSATQLLQAGTTLSNSNEEQSRGLSQQAAALQEAQVTSQEIRQTSIVAAERAASVLNVALRAEQLFQTGEQALTHSIDGMASIRRFVEGIQEKVARLSESALQISTITETVKDLADQSNMLALNAAIEAVRSGEHGKGFGVVAREIRSLSDQSIRATGNIQTIIEDITHAVADAVTMTDEGARQVETGLAQLKTSGASLRELSGIVQENAAAVRQISAAVGQQNEGISQIFGAIKDLSNGMEDTVQRLARTQQAAKTLLEVTGHVDEIARRYKATLK